MTQYSARAYEVFLAELGRHLETVRSLEEQKDQNLDQQTYERLRVLFHTVRGGAGFFGYRDLAECANELEQCCASKVEEVHQVLTPLLEIFEQQANQIIENGVPVSTNVKKGG